MCVVCTSSLCSSQSHVSLYIVIYCAAFQIAWLFSVHHKVWNRVIAICKGIFQSSLTIDDLAAKAVLSDPVDKLSHKHISEI